MILNCCGYQIDFVRACKVIAVLEIFDQLTFILTKWNDLYLSESLIFMLALPVDVCFLSETDQEVLMALLITYNLLNILCIVAVILGGKRLHAGYLLFWLIVSAIIVLLKMCLFLLIIYATIIFAQAGAITTWSETFITFDFLFFGKLNNTSIQFKVSLINILPMFQLLISFPGILSLNSANI